MHQVIKKTNLHEIQKQAHLMCPTGGFLFCLLAIWAQNVFVEGRQQRGKVLKNGTRCFLEQNECLLEN